jgi:hypothetical protein
MTKEIPFTRDTHAKVHAEGAIRQICSPYRSHEDGLPEWVKNSDDEYTRLNIPKGERAIVLLFQNGRGERSPMVACLDFGGITSQIIEDKFAHWADPNAAGSVEGVQGGHGNGGKCYMTQLFGGYSYLHSVKDGKGCKYGFVGGHPVPGYFPSPEKGRNYKVTDPEEELTEALQVLGIAINDLPEPAKAIWAKRKSFTIALGVGAKNLQRNHIPANAWLNSLAGHQQMVVPLQRSDVFAFHNGKPLEDSKPLQLPEIEPIPGADAARIIPIPATLVDPRTGETVETGSGPESRLELRTSVKSMRYERRLARHTVAAWTLTGQSTGYWEMSELSSAAYANKIYGTIYLDALADYRQNDRHHHSNAALTRALHVFISEQIEKYSDEFVKQDRLQATKEQQDELSRINRELNKWKNNFLESRAGGLGKENSGIGDTPRPPRPSPLPGGQVVQVVLGISHQAAGRGVAFRPSIDFFDASGKRVRAVAHEWRTSDPYIVSYDESLNMLTTGKPGKCELSVVCKDSGVSSNAIEIEVLDIASISLSPTEIQMPALNRAPITATVITKDGREIKGVYLVWTENDRSIVSVGSNGMVYGLISGMTEVTAGDDFATAASVKITVLDAKEAAKTGGGFPVILLSEIDADPLGEHPPVFSSADPPVYQRPQDVDAEIWWINMAAPLARRYIDAARGGGSKSREWRVYHLERFSEVLVKIVLSSQLAQGDHLSFETMLRRWEEEATIVQQRAAETLSGFLDGGEIETEVMQEAA